MGLHYRYDTANAGYQLEFSQYIEVVAISDEIRSNAIRSIYETKLFSLRKALRHFENIEIKAVVTFTGVEEKMTLRATVSIDCQDESFRKILDAVTHRYQAIFIPG
ncbi:MAG: hypothetical protein EOP56_05755 [Sphingobacteriales bacterium]|nr:MAG: hypothetical protein EOP56_05755 [Sphingobacteriales bacterium]